MQENKLLANDDVPETQNRGYWGYQELIPTESNNEEGDGGYSSGGGSGGE